MILDNFNEIRTVYFNDYYDLRLFGNFGFEKVSKFSNFRTNLVEFIRFLKVLSCLQVINRTSR